MMNEIFITRPILPDLGELMELLEQSWDAATLTNFGPHERNLTAQLQTYFDVDNLLLFNNGHMAIEAMLSTLEPGGEVITTPFTFASTIHAILNTGHTPVFVDVNDEDLGPDPDQVQQAITPNTRAVLGVHVYGVPCDLAALEAIGRDYNIRILYDAAHTFGVQHDGRSLVSYGDAAAVSFHATKVFNTVEGGCLSVNTDAIPLQRCKDFRNFGLTVDDVVSQSSNAKMSEVHAAVGLLNLKAVDAALKRRKIAASKYNAALAEALEFTLLLPTSPNASYYPIIISGKQENLAEKRKHLISHMAEKKVFSRPYFSPALHKTSYFSDFSKGRDYPRTSLLADSVLCLPIHDSITENELDHVCEVLLSF